MSRATPLLAAIAVVAIGALAWPYTVDDAFVLARYAERIATGRGYTFVDGPPTDGVTGPLALVPGIVATWLGASSVSASKLVGLACGALAALLVTRHAMRASGSRVAAPVTALVVSLAPTLGVWSVAGLETGIATLVATLAGLAAIARPAPRPIVLGVAIALAAWLRPELALFALVLSAATLVRARRAGLIALGIALSGALAVVIFRASMFGSPLPLAFWAKPAELANGGPYVVRALLATGLALGAWPAWVAARASRSARVITLALVAHVLAVLVGGGDWMPGYRLFAPVLPLAAWLVARGIARLARTRRRTQSLSLSLSLSLASLSLVLVLALPLVDLAIQLPAVRAAGAPRESEGRALATWLREHGGRVALVDVGYLAWAGQLDVVDLAGITDPSIARLPGGHCDKRIDGAMLLARDVELIVLHSTTRPLLDARGDLTHLSGHPTERRLAADPRVRSAFRAERVARYASAYWYVVLAREDAFEPHRFSGTLTGE